MNTLLQYTADFPIQRPYLDPFLAGPGPYTDFTRMLCDVNVHGTTGRDHSMTQFERGMNAVLTLLDANVPAQWALFEIVIDQISQFPTLAQHGIASPKVQSFERFEELRAHMAAAQQAVEAQNLGNFRIVVVGILNEFTTAAVAA